MGFLELEEDVIKNGFCTYCGACSSFCKNIVLNETPHIIGSCVLTHENVISCGKKGLCYDICPVTPFDERIVEMKFLDGKKDDVIGRYLEITAGRSHIEGQDGGMVSLILQKGLEMGYECAIVAKKKDGFDALPSIAISPQDVLEARGTKYVSIPMISKLKEAVKSGFRKILIVATPCGVKAARKIQLNLFGDIVKLMIVGLFCFESFNYDALRNRIKEILGIDINEAKKIQIGKGKFIIKMNGSVHSVNVSDLDAAVRYNCKFCHDFTARFADISVGSVGSREGYSTMIVRSMEGKRILDAIDFKESSVNLNELYKVSSLKRRKVIEKIPRGIKINF